jgi:hypothetical protein
MKFKGTTILFLLFLVLGVFVYLTEFRGREEREQAEAAEKKAIPVEENNITEISLIYPDKTITGIKKGENQWEITNPAGIQADAEEWNRLASNVAGIEREQTVADNAGDLSPFGLQNPPVRVAAKLADGRTAEVAFGGDNPSKTFSYAKLADNSQVFLTANSWKSLFTKDLNDLRNKQVLQFEADENIDAVRIAEGRTELEFQKSGENWLLKKPLEAPADNTEINALISSIRFARASSFAEPSVNAKTAVLDPPAIRIVLHDAKANADRTLLIGGTPQLDRYYARDASREPIMIIDKELPDKARRPVFEWRDKSITRLQRDRIDEIEIVSGADKFSFKKVEADWKLPDGRKIAFDKVSSLLSSLEFDKVSDIIDSPRGLATYGLDKPKLEVVFRQGTTELLRLSFGADSRQPEGVYLKTSEKPAVHVVPRDVFNKFNVKADALVEQTPSSQ